MLTSRWTSIVFLVMIRANISGLLCFSYLLISGEVWSQWTVRIHTIITRTSHKLTTTKRLGRHTRACCSFLIKNIVFISLDIQLIILLSQPPTVRKIFSAIAYLFFFFCQGLSWPEMLANDNKEASKHLGYMNFNSTFHTLKNLRLFAAYILV